jgi:hypothetical protein
MVYEAVHTSMTGRGLEEICRSFTLLQIKLRDSAFSKREE